MSFLCKSITKSYGGTVALNDVSFQFPTAGIVALIGPNGAGKTTLQDVLSGFVSPDAGTCVFKSQNIIGLPAHRIARLGIGRTFQDLRLLTRMTALQNVLLSIPEQRGESLIHAVTGRLVAQQEKALREHAIEILSYFGIDTLEGDAAGMLSYGQQKLLSLACCMATGAAVLLLDEPVSGVDPHHLDEIVNKMLVIRNTGKLIVFIEHDLEAVRQIADIVVLMDDGRIVASGTPTEILSDAALMGVYFE